MILKSITVIAPDFFFFFTLLRLSRTEAGHNKGLTERRDSANYLLVTTKEGNIYVFRRKKKINGPK